MLDVLGTVDARAIRALVHELDSRAESIFYFAANVGALFGVTRRDGSRVALKVHKPLDDEGYLDEVQRLQGALADAGFPAPRPLGRLGNVTWEEWLDDGSFRDAHEPTVRRALVSALVRFHVLATATPHRPRRGFFRREYELWPPPHNVLFDFEATSAGAEWIDEIGRAAKPLADASVGREVVGHADWSAKHLRFDANLLPTALYDWDSVQTESEAHLVGTAAGSFTYTEELSHPIDVWPSRDESVAFLDDYENARGEPFAFEERRAAQAACVFLRAYAARCTHAVGGDSRRACLEALAAELL